MNTWNKIQKIEKQRLKAIKDWNVPLLDKLDNEIAELKAVDTEEINKLIRELNTKQRPKGEHFHCAEL